MDSPLEYHSKRPFTIEEDLLLIDLVSKLGNKWEVTLSKEHLLLYEIVGFICENNQLFLLFYFSFFIYYIFTF